MPTEAGEQPSEKQPNRRALQAPVNGDDMPSAKYIDRKGERLNKNIPIETLSGKRITNKCNSRTVDGKIYGYS
ncbi:hypothetical protein [Microvirga calopogonii]|uniref:hypothetical protein n=1 Tax=Microvirga calopogonii TaxID=2078013 RepID=UPI001FE15BD3|nr:hypothetical protein [Microvirga calopogonii]